MSNHLDPDQDRCSACPDLGPNCLQRLPTIDSFHIVSVHAPNSLVPRYFREISHEGATFIRLPYIIHNGIWKTIKRKIYPQIKNRQIVKLNDK